MLLLAADTLPDIGFSGIAEVAALAVIVPLAVHFVRRLPLPSAVLEIVAGIILGPSVLGWIEVDLPIYVLSLLGLSILLFLGGLEIDLATLRGPIARMVGGGFIASLALALLFGLGLQGIGVVRDGALIAIILASTSLGIVLPMIKDAGYDRTPYGQLALAAASVGEFVPVLLLSVFFSSATPAVGSHLVMLGLFTVFSLAVFATLGQARRMHRIGPFTRELQDTSAQIGIRAMFALLAILGAVALRLGFSGILGTFVAGAIVRQVDRDATILNERERTKLNAIGYGIFVPFFWITTGLQFDLDALLETPVALLRVPIFLGGLLLARGLPALLYVRLVGTRQAVSLGLLQATSLSFIVVAAQLGQTLGLIVSATSAALITAALISALVFPVLALAVAPVPAEAGQPAQAEAG